MLTEKRKNLNDKIEHARELRNNELETIKQKAQNDILAVEDIKYIKLMVQENLQMDIKNKLNETEERRNQHFLGLLKKLEEKKVKEEEV